MLFADDLQIYLQCAPKDMNVTIAKLNEDASNIASWARENGLSLNISKTKALLIGTDQHHIRLDIDQIDPVIIDEVVIPFSHTARNLGVVLSKTLAWNEHISQVCSRVHYALYRLRYKGFCLSTKLKSNLVSSLILPLFDYCCLVYQDLPDYLAIKLQRLCNMAVRYIFRLKYDASLEPYYRRLGWLSLDKRRTYYLGIAMYKVSTSNKPLYVADLFPPPDEELRRSARQTPSAFQIPTATLEMYRRGFSIRGMHLWDELPVKIKLSATLNI